MLVLCVADGLLFVAGRTLAGHRVLAGERHRRFEGNHGRSRHFDVLWVVAAGNVLRRGLLEGEKTPHELIIKFIIILTSVAPRGLPIQMSIAVKAVLMFLHSRGYRSILRQMLSSAVVRNSLPRVR